MTAAAITTIDWASLLDRDGLSTPEMRVALLAEVVRQGAILVGPINATGFSETIRKVTGLPEESVGGDIVMAMFMAINAGFFTSPQKDENAGEWCLGRDTTMTASRVLTGYVWDERFVDPDHVNDDL